MDRVRSAGFTLLELMIVVIILGVLAAIAVASFTKHYQYSKSSEVYALMRDIAAKQESYRSEFGQYLNVSGTMDFANRRPAAAPTDDFGFVGWVPGADAIDQGWNQLGFRPQGAVRFAYVVVAGPPGGTVTGVPAGLANNADFWWAAVAYGNYDGLHVGDDADCSQYYLSSTKNVFAVVNEFE
ncbi:MAG: prepilin-type N-terminal cleavage/methylation domain-containing protein [Myxococcota bacterium]|nr:prepilin-type N-terminal cleavage/methylation domain-containing protein [Myxococcota bacterium]